MTYPDDKPHREPEWWEQAYYENPVDENGNIVIEGLEALT